VSHFRIQNSGSSGHVWQILEIFDVKTAAVPIYGARESLLNGYAPVQNWPAMGSTPYITQQQTNSVACSAF